jgi:hypothetical protein
MWRGNFNLRLRCEQKLIKHQYTHPNSHKAIQIISPIPYPFKLHEWIIFHYLKTIISFPNWINTFSAVQSHNVCRGRKLDIIYTPAHLPPFIHLCRPDTHTHLVRYEYPQTTFNFSSPESLFTLRINCYFLPILVRHYLKLCSKDCFVPDEEIYGPPYVSFPPETQTHVHTN